MHAPRRDDIISKNPFYFSRAAGRSKQGLFVDECGPSASN